MALVSTEWLAKALVGKKPINFHLLHVSFGCNEFATGLSIPASQCFDLNRCRDQQSSLSNTVPSRDQFVQEMHRMRIGHRNDLILFDANPQLPNVMAAARGWFLFRLFRHGGSVSLLDGGLAQWQLENRPCQAANQRKPEESDGSQSPSTTGDNGWQKDESLLIDFDQLSHEDGRRGWQLLDARSAESFKAGCLPGAANLHYAHLLDGFKFRQPDQLKSQLERLGMAATKPLVASCGTGVTACSLLFTWQLLGCQGRSRLYDGSWQEWSKRYQPPAPSA